MEFMTTMAEQNNPFQKFNVVLSDKITLAVQDITNLQSDTGVAEGSNVLTGNSSSAASEHAQENGVNDNSRTACPPECTAIFDSQHIHHVHLPQSQSNAFYNQTGDMQVIAAVPVYVYLDDTVDTRKKRSKKEVKARPVPSRQVSKSPRKKRTGEGEDLSKQVAKAFSEWTGQAVAKGGEELNNGSSVKFEWKNRDVGLNEVTFDEATMPAPVCSCTGTAQRCYRWGNGGWQSSCCTPTLSMYPLPFLPIKRHGRVSGRKMSGGAFTKLLSRMAAEGHDLSTPLDLKDHWAKHGTNGWITIK